LPFFRSHGELVVVLPVSPAPGTEITLELSYEARPFDQEGSRFWLRRTLAWHPRVGEDDRATFEATVRWPRELTLVGNGRLVESGESNGLRWQRRVMADTPCTGFSFELGMFEVLKKNVGHIEVTVAIDSSGRKISASLDQDIFETLEDSLTYFEEVFGPYPLDSLDVVTSPRVYSQGLLGFITLSSSAMGDLGEWGSLLGVQDRRLLIAHELAHQWWGNLVGWRSYRDQWISEAMANYAALLYWRHRLPHSGDNQHVYGPTTGWTSWLLKTTGHGVPVEALGPVVLGTRLKSAHNHRAYEAIVYKKGAIILDTLARLFAEEDFLKVLRQIVAAESFRSISTEELLDHVERISGLDLSWFARQYIYGTGIAEVFYTYEISPGSNGGWTITGSCHQQSPYHYRQRVVELDGTFDIQRWPTHHLELDGSIMVVPFIIGLKPLAEAPTRPSNHHRVLSGNVLIRGIETPLLIETIEEPEVLWLDRRQEVFGRFFCETCWPRQTMLTHGLNLEAEGRIEEAEEMLRRALDQPMVNVPASWQDAASDLEYQKRVLDIQIHLALARLYLDNGRLSDTDNQLVAARSLMTGGDRWQFDHQLLAVEARLKLKRGDPRAAYDLLFKPLQNHQYARAGETFALLAIAARALDKKQVQREASRQAEAHGIDMTALSSAG
jgi:hypothetical protein